MIFDKELLDKLNKVQGKHPSFNIHVFLHMLQITTRPLGYPPYKLGTNNEFYLDHITKEILSAESARNSRKVHSFMESIYRIMLCFCYLQNTLPIHKINEEVLSLLLAAIDKRMDTTDEERCAEKSLLTMLVQKPRDTLNLIASNDKRLVVVNIQSQMQEQVNQRITKKTKSIVEDLPTVSPITVTISTLSSLLDTFKEVNKALEALPSVMRNFTKRECQATIGLYLLDNSAKPMDEPWIKDCPFLKSATNLGIREKGKKEVKSYIAEREAENDYFSYFRKYPKAVKLSSADKFFKALDYKKVDYTEAELGALQSDEDSRLTALFRRYPIE